MHDRPRFTTSEVAHAIGVAPATLAIWFTRDLVSLTKHEAAAVAAPGSGRRRLFTLQQALHLGLVAELSRAGIEIAAASQMARMYSHMGETVAGPIHAMPESRRGPGDLFPLPDQTIFRVFVGQNGDEEARIDTLREAVEKGFFWSRSRSYPHVVAVDLNALDRRVRSALPKREDEHEATST
jgi:DNA-binding transcriptional MerR regulator